jgi:hypothetical protein
MLKRSAYEYSPANSSTVRKSQRKMSLDCSNIENKENKDQNRAKRKSIKVLINSYDKIKEKELGENSGISFSQVNNFVKEEYLPEKENSPDFEVEYCFSPKLIVKNIGTLLDYCESLDYPNSTVSMRNILFSTPNRKKNLCRIFNSIFKSKYAEFDEQRQEVVSSFENGKKIKIRHRTLLKKPKESQKEKPKQKEVFSIKKMIKFNNIKIEEEEPTLLDLEDKFTKNFSDPSFKSRSNPFLRKTKRSQKYTMFTKEEKEYCINLVTKDKIDPIDVANCCEVPLKSLKRWLLVGADRKKGGGRKVKDPELEQKLVDWCNRQINRGIKIKYSNVRNIALRLSNQTDFIASKGWYEKFKRKNTRLFKQPN